MTAVNKDGPALCKLFADMIDRDMELEADLKISSCGVRVTAFAAGLCIERWIEHFLRSQTV